MNTPVKVGRSKAVKQRIPKTPSEAERVLWHAIEHITGYSHCTLSDLDARVIMRRAICLLNDHLTCSCQ